MKSGTVPRDHNLISTRNRFTQNLHALCLVAALSSGLGCSHLAKTRARAREQLEEHSHALTTAVVDSLQSQPIEHRDAHTALALDLARENQRIDGLPESPILIEPLLGLFPSNTPPAVAQARQEKARAALDQRFATIETEIKRDHAATRQLENLGVTFEAERNRARAHWFKLAGSGTILLVAFIALCIFAPATLPILGRFLAWIVGKIPSAAGALGVIGVKAFDAVVTAVERTKSESDNPSGTAALRNDSRRETTPEANRLGTLHLHLSRQMDSEHKALVRARKGALGL